MTSLLKYICAAALALTLPAAPLAAAEPDDEADVLELSLDDNIATPEVPKRAKTYIRTAMDQLRRLLIKKGYTVESLRDGEVLEVTISCADLFGPGAVELKAGGRERLKELGTTAVTSERYKVAVAVHADDTGDEQYADSITAARANAIDDYFWQLAGQKDTNVVPYGIGRDEPRVPNDSRANRNINRRVEIFIIPDKGLLEMAGVKPKK